MNTPVSLHLLLVSVWLGVYFSSTGMSQILYEGSGDVDEVVGENVLTGDSAGHASDMSDAEKSGPVRDVVDEFLSIVEQYERNRDNCTPGTTFNLGEGVVAQYGVNQFRRQAMLAVQRANLLTRLWKASPPEMLDSEYFFYTQVRSIVESDQDLFAAGNCYDAYEYKNYSLFCPYSHRLPNNSGEIIVKDLSLEYPYLGNDSEFFLIPRQNARAKLEAGYNESIGEYLF